MKLSVKLPELYLDSRVEYEEDSDRYVTKLVLPVEGQNNREKLAALEIVE